jgi:hypothetical protein
VRRSPLEWVAATGLHFVILATLIIVPLYTTETIRPRNYEDTPLAAPPAAPPPPPPAAGRAVAPHVASKRPTLTYTLGKVTAPASIPKTISLDSAAPAPDLPGVDGGVPGGVVGDNSAVRSAEFLAGRALLCRYRRLRRGLRRSESFALAPLSKHLARRIRSSQTIQYSRSKSTSGAPWSSTRSSMTVET